MPYEVSNNKNVLYTDPNNGIYKDVDGSWYLENGTPIWDYDPSTSAYQEEDGTWYTFHGVELKAYDKKTGSYQELDGTWYSKNGTPVPETATKPIGTPKAPTKTNQPIPSKPNKTMLIIGISVAALAIAGLVYFFVIKKKK